LVARLALGGLDLAGCKGWWWRDTDCGSALVEEQPLEALLALHGQGLEAKLHAGREIRAIRLLGDPDHHRLTGEKRLAGLEGEVEPNAGAHWKRLPGLHEHA
jgi:hypothetical protein